MLQTNGKTFSLILLLTSAGFCGFIIGQSIIVFGQNTTNSTPQSPAVASIDQLIYTAIIPTVIAIISLLSVLAQRGIFDKKFGTAMVMAADASRAALDTRTTFNKYANTSYDVMKIASPELADKADKQMAPILNEISDRIKEYKPKVEAFADIANAQSKSGEKTIAEIQPLKRKIPNDIIPTTNQ